jgi:prevent-host-death family protein
MPHQTISLREANQNFSRLIAAVERGEGFVITRRGCEVARLTPSGALAHAQAGASADATMTLPDAALSERLQRLEIAVDKLVAALADPHKE